MTFWDPRSVIFVISDLLVGSIFKWKTKALVKDESLKDRVMACTQMMIQMKSHSTSNKLQIDKKTVKKLDISQFLFLCMQTVLNKKKNEWFCECLIYNDANDAYFEASVLASFLTKEHL